MKKQSITLKYLIISLFLFTVNNAMAYTPPVGIPDPTLDFEQPLPSRPSNWTEETPGYYYIDTINGSYAPVYGSETTPRKYLPKPIPAGSYIEIAGDYNYAGGGVISILSQGTDDTWVPNKSGPVWITSAKNNPGTFTNYKVLMYGENLFLTDMLFRNGSTPQTGSSTKGYPAKNIVIRNIDVAGPIGIQGAATNSGSDNIIVYSSSFHDAGDINSPIDEDVHVVTVNAYSSNIWILKNTMHTASGAGLQVHGGHNHSTDTNNIYIGDNEVYNVRQSGIWVKSGKNVIISSNYVHDILTTPWSQSKGIGSQYEPNGLWIINNHIEGVEYGIRVTSYGTLNENNFNPTFESTFYIIGNIIHNIEAKSETALSWIGGSNTWQVAGINVVGGHKLYAYNNLIYDAPNGITIANKIEAEIKNNIILDISRQQKEGVSGRYIWSELTGFKDKIKMSNNYFDQKMRVDMHQGLIRVTYNTEAELIAAGSLYNIRGKQLLSDIDLETILASKSIDGFDLQRIADLGTNGTIRSLYQTAFGRELDNNIDILGAVRYQGASIDIGPFETSGYAQITPIDAPNQPIILDVIQVQ